jgi:hypothetical protein
VENLKAAEEIVAVTPEAVASPPPAPPAALAAGEAEARLPERQALELALLNARVKHLELIVETARSLMNSNQERLLRRLHEMPHEITEIALQLRRLDGPGSPSAL